MSEKTASETAELKSLADLLNRSTRVIKLGQATGAKGPEEVASEAADGLLDIRKSAKVLFEVLLPRLQSLPPDGAEFSDVLDDIAEEYRHIYYHITNTRLFKYVVF